MLVLSAGFAQAVPILVNGGFETDPWAAGDTNHASPSGWVTVQSSDGRFVDGVHNTIDTTNEHTPFGNQFIILCAVDCFGNTLGSVSQSVSGFVVGGLYRLDFAQSPEIDAQGHFDAIVGVTITGAASSTTNFSAISAGIAGHSWADWKAQSLTFTADATTLNFQFAGATPDGPCAALCDIESGIDNISVTQLASVPEPASIALVGLGILGLCWSRRKRA
jgi:hypothetical protein